MQTILKERGEIQMSKYTTEVRYICENYAGLDKSVGYDSVADVLDKSWNKVFDFPFPVFDEDYREPLCKKILKHYYTREIGEETVGLWKLRLDAKMNEIMPYFNKLYNSELVAIDPLINYRYKDIWNKKKTGQDTEQGSKSITETTSGSNSNVRTGGYTDTGTGTDAKAKTGKDTLTRKGEELDTKKGEITKTKEGEISDTHTGQGITTERYEGLGGKVTEENIDLFTDTPQGNIQNMGTSYSSIPSSSGVPIVGQDSAYLTTAEKTTNEREDLGKWKKENGFGEDGSGNPYKETNTRFYGHDDGQGNVTPYTEKENYGSDGVTNKKTFTNRQDETEYASSVTETRNLSDVRVYN